MDRAIWLRRLCLVLALLFWAGRGHAQTFIVLKNDFIERYKDRATIDLDDFTVDFTHEKANDPEEDGDLHIAGKSKTVGLALVAEIMNAAAEKGAVDLAATMKGTQLRLKMAGAWRLWCEHARVGQIHSQNGPLPHYEHSNPDHVFEIHPVTQFGTHNLLHTFAPVPGFEGVLRVAGRTGKVFDHYNNRPCELRAGPLETTIVTKVSRYNYVEFVMKLATTPTPLEDGTVVHADVYDFKPGADDETLAESIRMVFTAGTPPEKAVQAKKPGAKLRVLGIPRISLAQVKERLDLAKQDKQALTWNLPYEMIIAAVFDEEQIAMTKKITGKLKPQTGSLDDEPVSSPPAPTTSDAAAQKLAKDVAEIKEAVERLSAEAKRQQQDSDKQAAPPPITWKELAYLFLILVVVLMTWIMVDRIVRALRQGRV